tara:strand:- start:3842 stop:7678 length:3837 start_codon:yes stop_codon:yes gene_type:complete
MPNWLVAGLKYLAGKEVVKQFLFSFLIGKVMERLAPEPEAMNFQHGLKLNNTSNVAPIPVIYGRARVGGSEFRAVYGAENEKLLRCMVLSEGEIDSVENVYLNDRLSTDTSTTPTLASRVTTHLQVGTQNQTANTVMQNFAQWTPNFKGNGIAYLVTQLDYDKDVFASGLPTITADVKGKKVYDPRRDDGGSITVANGSNISASAPAFGATQYTTLISEADGHPDINNGTLRIWHRHYPNDTGTYTPTTLGTPFERLGTPTSFSATSDSFNVVNNSGSEIRIGMLTSRTVYASEADHTLLTISGTVNSLTTTGANLIPIAPTQGTTGGGSWTPDGGNAYITTTGDFSFTIDLEDNPTQYNLQGINFFIGDGEAINVSNIKFSLHDKDVDTKTSSYSYNRDTDTLTMRVARTGGVGGYGSYFRINALKEGVYYRVTGKARVVKNTTGGTAKAFWDLSDGNDTGEFTNETTSSTFVDIDDSGYFSINGTYNTTTLSHSFIDINLSVVGSTVTTGEIVVEYQNLKIEELTSGTLNANSNQTVVNATHSKTNPATWEWSENPALCILDFLTNTVYGRGIPYDDIDLQSFITSANYCDDRTLTLVDEAGNDMTGQKRFTCNGVVNPDEEAISTLRKLLISCRGTLVVSDKYKLVIDKPEISVFTFDKSNIIGEWTIAGSGVRNYKNKIKARFRNKNNRYDEDISITTGTNFLADDNNRQLVQEVMMPFTNEQQRVDLLSQHLLKQTRLKWSVSFTATLEALALEAMDVVRIKHSTVGWDSGSLSEGKLFRVSSVELLSEDTVKITATEYDSSVYSFDVNTPPSAPTTNLPDPNSAIPPSNLALDSSDLLVSKDGTIIERIKATWSAPNFGYVNHYEIAYKEQSDSGFSIISTDDTTFFISPVNSTNDVNTGIYFVKVRAVYPNDRRSTWYPSDAGLEHEVAGKSTKPNRPTGFHYDQLADYTRSLEFVPPNDPDFAGVKIKFSSNVNETYDNMTSLHEGIVTESPYNFTILSAGTYGFRIKSVDTSGNESEASTFTEGIVTDNPNFEILASYYPRLLGWLTVGTTSTAFVDTAGDLTSNAGSSAEWQDLGTTTWDNWNEWGFASETMVYETNGFEFGTTLTFRPVIQSSQVGTVTHQVAIVPSTSSASQPYSASDYGSYFTPSGSVDAKAIKTKTTVTGVNATLLALGILLDGKQTEETLLNIDTSTLDSSYRVGTGHIHIPLQKEFNNITTIQVSVVNAGGNRNIEIISKTNTVNSKLAPTIKIYNGSTLADATIDVIVRGY